MKKYFVAREGIQKGPWTLDEITQNIQNKILTWNDYIYDEKINVWLYLFEYPLLTEAFNRSFKSPLQKNENNNNYKDRVWYILKVNENYGPFTAFEMIQMLQSKTLFEFDFIWRQEQSSWRRLSDVEAFHPTKIKEIFESSSLEPSTEIKDSFFRRRFPRVNHNCELLVHNRQNLFSAECIEISAGGASFKVDGADFELGSQLYIHFKPDSQIPAFNATCTVISKSGNKYGVSFIAASSMAKDSIEKFAKKAA